jgi:hypothetical protein
MCVEGIRHNGSGLYRRGELYTTEKVADIARELERAAPWLTFKMARIVNGAIFQAKLSICKAKPES